MRLRCIRAPSSITASFQLSLSLSLINLKQWLGQIKNRKGTREVRHYYFQIDDNTELIIQTMPLTAVMTLGIADAEMCQKICTHPEGENEDETPKDYEKKELTAGQGEKTNSKISTSKAKSI